MEKVFEIWNYMQEFNPNIALHLALVIVINTLIVLIFVMYGMYGTSQ